MRCDPEHVETNIVFGEARDGTPAADLVEEMTGVGVLCSTIDDRTIRFVTHLDVDSDAVSAVIERLQPMLR
jgi:threonine aldolase